jgi:hypothetical protein
MGTLRAREFAAARGAGAELRDVLDTVPFSTD